MPELPEVQTTVSGLHTHISGLTIAEVWTDYNSPFQKGKDSVKDPEYFTHFKKAVLGVKVERVTRRAKNILIHISGGHIILVHMKMTGHMMYGKYELDKAKEKRGEKDPWSPKLGERPALSDPFNRFIHFVISFTNGHQVVLSDMRKFAKITLIHATDIETSTHLESVGPEPLELNFTFTHFKERLSKKPNGKIKTVLMDQSIIAGVGNIYSDEALWRTGIHPEEPVKNIPEKLLKHLFVDVRAVLEKGIDFGGDSMSDYRNIHGERGTFQETHQAYRKTGSACTLRGCKGIILRKVVGGRSAHFCSVHQKRL